MLFRFLIGICFVWINSHADAWIQPKGHWNIIPFFGAQTQNYFNKNTGGITEGIDISATIWSLYGEYGLTDTTNIGAQIYTVGYSNTTNHEYKGQEYGIEWMNLFFRRLLYKKDNFVATLQGLVKLPGAYDQNAPPYQFFPKQRDYELGFEMGWGISQNKYYRNLNNANRDFLIFSTRYRKREDLFIDETRVELTYGHRLRNDIMFMINGQKTNYFNDDYKTPDIWQNIAVTSGRFDVFGTQGMLKMTYSLVFQIDDEKSVELGYYNTIPNETFKTHYQDYNIQGIFIAYWVTY